MQNGVEVPHNTPNNNINFIKNKHTKNQFGFTPHIIAQHSNPRLIANDKPRKNINNNNNMNINKRIDGNVYNISY